MDTNRQRFATPGEDEFSRENQARLVALAFRMGVVCTEPWLHLSRRGHMELHFGPGRYCADTGREITTDCSLVPWEGVDVLSPQMNMFCLHLGPWIRGAPLERWLEAAEERVSA